ncbi:hypothetical protein GX441_12475 [bacterium]|nr:hypothetical protein [bacterium]
MKKIMTAFLTTTAGLLLAASSDPVGKTRIAPVDDNIMYVSWSGEGTGAWQKFEIYYDMETGLFEGKWWYDDEHSGTIKGAATAEIPGGVTGKGRFGGDYAGAWTGTFYFRGICFGKTWAKSDPPGDGEFKGI